MRFHYIFCNLLLDFKFRTSRNTFQGGEHGLSNFSTIILSVVNVSLNVLNVSFECFECFFECFLYVSLVIVYNFSYS